MVSENYKRMAKKFISGRLNVKSDADLQQRLNSLDWDDYYIILCRWGLNDGIYCKTFAILDKKMNIQDSKQKYSIAIENLKKARYVVMVKDYHHIPFHLAHKLGLLGCAILNQPECKIYGKQLWKCIDDLPSDMRYAIEARFGLRYGVSRDYTTIGKELGISFQTTKRLIAQGMKTLYLNKEDFISPEPE